MINLSPVEKKKIIKNRWLTVAPDNDSLWRQKGKNLFIVSHYALQWNFKTEIEIPFERQHLTSL